MWCFALCGTASLAWILSCASKMADISPLRTSYPLLTQDLILWAHLCHAKQQQDGDPPEKLWRKQMLPDQHKPWYQDTFVVSHWESFSEQSLAFAGVLLPDLVHNSSEVLVLWSSTCCNLSQFWISWGPNPTLLVQAVASVYMLLFPCAQQKQPPL